MACTFLDPHRPGGRALAGAAVGGCGADGKGALPILENCDAVIVICLYCLWNDCISAIKVEFKQYVKSRWFPGAAGAFWLNCRHHRHINNFSDGGIPYTLACSL